MKNLFFFILFISIVILVYSLLNYYFIKKHNNVLTLSSLPRLLSRLIIFTVTLTPFVTVLFSGLGITNLAVITSFTGYSWLAFLFLFLAIHGTADILLFIIEKAGVSAPKYMAKAVFTATMLISIFVLVFGFFEARNPKVDRIEFETSKLPDNISSVKIMQISDVHFSPLINDDMALKISAIAAQEKPDIIVSTGDMLDRNVRNSTNIQSIMNKMDAPLGKYAITGNHEFIADIQYSLDFISKTGFFMIRNNLVTANNTINLVGIDDPTIRRNNPGIDLNKAEKETLSSIKNGLYTVLLKHQPRVNEENTKYFDLQLSGHTHAGQIFPFTTLVKITYPYLRGLYELSNGSVLYVSKGTGTWGPPFRFLADPEITIIKIKKK